MKNILGKKVVCFRGFKEIERFGKKKEVSLSFILFDDRKTYIELKQQDRYDYHDCNSSARTIEVHEDAQQWQRMFDMVDYYEESTEDSF